MNALLWANNITSMLVVFTCWWLAHSNARATPPGRLIATGYSMIGLSVLFTLVVRNFTIEPDVVRWLIVVTKGLIGATFSLVIYRRFKLGYA